MFMSHITLPVYTDRDVASCRRDSCDSLPWAPASVSRHRTAFFLGIGNAQDPRGPSQAEKCN